MFIKNENYVKPFLTEEMQIKIYERIIDQVINNNIGMSAAAIVDRIKNCENSTKISRPYDSSDFRRCYLLVESTGIDISIMLGVSKEWENIVCSWETLSKSFLKKDGSFYPLLQKIVNIGR